MIRLADYVARILERHGIRHVFMVTGGGAMHLDDAFGRQANIEVVCCHHEQSCAMAAEAYYRVSNVPAAVSVTTGPGGTNAITGVYGAFVDSMAMIVISGQVKWETLVASTTLPLRQLGDQEVDIIEMVKGITKYAVLVSDPLSIRYHLERALSLMLSGRPGPVWLDIPINVQAAMIDPDSLKQYSSREDSIRFETSDLERIALVVSDKISKAKRPVIYAGTGIRLSGSYDLFLELVDRLGIPVVTAWNSNDLLPDENSYYAGRPGSLGNRAGNFTVQNADLLLVLGCRLNIRLVSYNWKSFAPKAFKVVVDIDAAELKKPTIEPDLPIHADLADFLPLLLKHSREQSAAHVQWVAWCRDRLLQYPVMVPDYRKTKGCINPYYFIDTLFRSLKSGEVIVCGDGTACVVAFQAAIIREGQRLFHNSGCAPMGYDLPAAVGAAIATKKERIICLAGDGSIMMNLQELQTIVGRKLPIKIFVLNNQGYHSIRQTQNNFFPDNIVGCGPDSGLSFPDFKRIADAFQIPFNRCFEPEMLQRSVEQTLSMHGAAICEICLDMRQPFAPKLSSRRLDDGQLVTSPLEDMAPFLPRDELRANMSPSESE